MKAILIFLILSLGGYIEISNRKEYIKDFLRLLKFQQHHIISSVTVSIVSPKKSFFSYYAIAIAMRTHKEIMSNFIG